MDIPKVLQIIALVSAVCMPVWNIPLILRILKRRSSKDISMFWVVGVWVCIMGMLPSSLISQDVVLKAFGIVNAILFSGVFVIALKFRHSDPVDPQDPSRH